MGACWKLGAPESVVPLHFYITWAWARTPCGCSKRYRDQAEVGKDWARLARGRMDGSPYLRSRSKRVELWASNICCLRVTAWWGGLTNSEARQGSVLNMV